MTEPHHYNWRLRAAAAARLVAPSVTSVLDLGCGHRILKRYLRPTVRYLGLDADPACNPDIVCDLRGKLPPIGQFDLAVSLGLWEYLTDAAVVSVAANVADHAKSLLTSHYSGHRDAQRSHEQFVALLATAGWQCQLAGGLGRRQEILYCARHA